MPPPAQSGYKTPERPSSLNAPGLAFGNSELSDPHERPSSAPITGASHLSTPFESLRSTPRSANSNLDPATATMNRQRDAAVENPANRAILVSTDFYQKSVLKHIPDSTLKTIEDTLVRDEVIVVRGNSRRWASFPNNPPGMPGPPKLSNEEGPTGATEDTEEEEEKLKKEDFVFANMQSIYANVIRVAAQALGVKESSASVSWVNTPKQRGWSPLRNGHFKADGSLMRRETIDPRPIHHKTRKTAAHTVLDHVDLQEFKMSRTVANFNEDTAKIMGNATHVLAADAGREYMFGVTIMNTSTRLWFFSRTHILVTEEFDFIKEPKHLIRYIASLAYSTYAELGYDKTVIRRVLVPNATEDDSEPSELLQFVYKLKGKSYQTEVDLDTFRAGAIVSRAPRIWGAVEIDDKGNPVIELDKQGNPVLDEQGNPKKKRGVIKDVWLSVNAPTEKEIIDSVRSQVGSVHPDMYPEFPPSEAQDAMPDTRDFDKYFLTIEAEEVVSRSEQYTHDLLLPKGDLKMLVLKIVQEAYKSEPAGAAGVRSSRGAVEPAGPSTVPDERLLGKAVPLIREEIEHKQHVRTLFAEQGRALYGVEDLRLVFQATVDAALALVRMFSRGWVHCDASPGNTLLMEEGPARLSDLEFARPFRDPKITHRARKTGTSFFMACEVLKQDYLFLPEAKPSEKASTPFYMRGRSQAGAQDNKQDSTSPFSSHQEKPFLHNYLHDAESVWWMCIYFLSKLPLKPGFSSKEYNGIFQHDTTLPSDRYAFFSVQGVFLSAMQKIEVLEAEADVALSRIVKVLEDARLHLITGYRAVEALSDFPCETTQDKDGEQPQDLFAEHISAAFHSIGDCVEPAQILTDYLKKHDIKLWRKPQLPLKRKHSEGIGRQPRQPLVRDVGLKEDSKSRAGDLEGEKRNQGMKLISDSEGASGHIESSAGGRSEDSETLEDNRELERPRQRLRK